MTPTIQIDSSQFRQAVNEALRETSQELSQAINARMFFLLLRLYTLLPTHDIPEKKRQIRTRLSKLVGQPRINKKTGKPVSRSKQLKSVHLIAQALNKRKGLKGLYGDEMKKAASSLLRRSIGSVGYLKSSVVKAMKIVNGHFTQFGSKPKRGGKASAAAGDAELVNYSKSKANAALLRINAEYGGLAVGNVSMFKGAKATATKALPGINPISKFGLTIGLGEGQLGRVQAIYGAAANRAMADEVQSIRRHLAAKVQEVADAHAPAITI